MDGDSQPPGVAQTVILTRTTVRASVKMEAVWDGGDWKVVAPPGGDWGNSAAELSSLAGYTAFPGQGGGR